MEQSNGWELKIICKGFKLELYVGIGVSIHYQKKWLKDGRENLLKGYCYNFLNPPLILPPNPSTILFGSMRCHLFYYVTWRVVEKWLNWIVKYIGNGTYHNLVMLFWRERPSNVFNRCESWTCFSHWKCYL